jgi:predicted Rossmann-fold nucleotide-binding protein
MNTFSYKSKKGVCGDKTRAVLLFNGSPGTFDNIMDIYIKLMMQRMAVFPKRGECEPTKQILY